MIGSDQRKLEIERGGGGWTGWGSGRGPDSLINPLLPDQLEMLGVEEGCPREEPAQLDQLLARQLVPASSPPPQAVSPHPRWMPAPQARPLPVPTSSQCDDQQHRKFAECVQPLTAFQPVRPPPQVISHLHPPPRPLASPGGDQTTPTDRYGLPSLSQLLIVSEPAGRVLSFVGARHVRHV